MSIFNFFRPRYKTWRTPDQSIIIDPQFDRMVRNTNYQNNPYSVIVGEWKGEDARPIYCDLNTAPHILVAGATGSGKSVSINTMLCSLLIKHSPVTLGLYMIDPKRVELARYRSLPHLKAPIATNLDSAERVLQTVHNEMESRFQRMERAGVLHIDELGMGHIVLVMDEFASLMSKEGKKRLLPHLQEIARLGRAAGVHMILATQRPTRDVLDGQLKSNCPTRLAFRVSSLTDSRVILDTRGAETLCGAGDGYIRTSQGDMWRFQGCYCSNQQVRDIVDFWAEQA